MSLTFEGWSPQAIELSSGEFESPKAPRLCRGDGLRMNDDFEIWLRGLDLNQRPSGYEPDELPGCSTPR